MSWSGGTYTKPLSWTANTTISAADHNTQDADFTTGINSCLVKDGTNSMTANLNFGGFRPSNVAAGSAATCSFAPGGSANSGMFLAATNEVGFASAGAELFRVSPTSVSVRTSTPNLYVGSSEVSTGTCTLSVGENRTGSGSAVIELVGDTTYTAGGLNLTRAGGANGASSITHRGTGVFTIGSAEGTEIALATEGVSQVRFYKTPNQVFPTVDNATQLGVINNRWTTVYAVNGTIQTSDAREKHDINDSALGLSFVRSLRPVSYRWHVGQNMVEKEKDANGRDILNPDGSAKTKILPRPGVRTHWGLIAQEVKAAVDAAGVDFGGWILSQKDDPDSQQGLRYDQFIAPLIQAVKELSNKVDALEAQVAGMVF